VIGITDSLEKFIYDIDTWNRFYMLKGIKQEKGKPLERVGTQRHWLIYLVTRIRQQGLPGRYSTLHVLYLARQRIWSCLCYHVLLYY
jgi:hypothetical protein